MAWKDLNFGGKFIIVYAVLNAIISLYCVYRILMSTNLDEQRAMFIASMVFGCQTLIVALNWFGPKLLRSEDNKE